MTGRARVRTLATLLIGVGVGVVGQGDAGQQPGSAAPTDQDQLIQAVAASSNLGSVGQLAKRIIERDGEKAIPWMIGVIDSDNSYASNYFLGCFSLRGLTGVNYNPLHDGAWWRRWWAANQRRFPAEVQAVPIPTLTKTKHGRQYQPFLADTDSLQGKLRLAPEILAEIKAERVNGKPAPRIDLMAYAIELARHEDPHAIPYLIGLLQVEKLAIYECGYYGLQSLTQVTYSKEHDAAWWLNWWEKNKENFAPDVRSIPIPDYREPLTFAWKEKTEPEKQQEADAEQQAALADVADVPVTDLTVAGNPRMRYFLVGPRPLEAAPREGFKLVVVLPGGDGGEGFNPFVRRLHKFAMPADFLVAQPVAMRWTPGQQIIWPTRRNAVAKQEFSSEELVEAVIQDVSKRERVDPRYIFTLSWSSGGPAAYATALSEKTAVTGSYVAMSVFHPKELPPVAQAKGRLFLVDHSPDDRVCPYRDAELAQQTLRAAGATVRLVTYEGGHGWRGPIYPRVAENLRWLVEQGKPIAP